MAKGQVKWFDAKKGYGFIQPDGGGDDIFVHFSEIQSAGYRTLEQGEAVEYEIETANKGPKAIKVKKA